MDLTGIFYREVIGIYPFPTSEEEYTTRRTIAYLLDCGLKEEEIFTLLPKYKKAGVITPESLPENLWTDGLTKKNTFYCHRLLHLVPPDPIVTENGFKSYPFYLEIRCHFMMKDLINYFHKKFPESLELSDSKKEAGQFKSMLGSFRFNDEKIQSLDMILYLIDECAHEHMPVYEPFDIKRNSTVTEFVKNEKLKKAIAYLHSEGRDKIIWRSYLIDDDGGICYAAE